MTAVNNWLLPVQRQSNPTRLRVPVGVLLSSSFSLCSSAATAESTDAAMRHARELDQEVKAAIDAGRLDDALRYEQEAIEADPAPARIFNLGILHEKNCQPTAAISDFLRFRTEAQCEQASEGTDLARDCEDAEGRIKHARPSDTACVRPGSGPESFPLPPAPATQGILTVTASPRTTQLKIEDPAGRQMVAESGYTNPGAMTGTWKITAQAFGYATEQSAAVVSAGNETSVTFDLQKAGGLSINGSPRGAFLSIRGPNDFRDDEHTLPWRSGGLRAGTYEVHVSASGYEDEVRNVQVPQGATATVQVRLQRYVTPPQEEDAPLAPPVLAPPSASPAREGGGQAAHPPSPRYFRLSLVGGYSAFGGSLGHADAEFEWRPLHGLSFFGDVGVGLPTIGLDWGVGIRWFFVDANVYLV
jgi:hypothetical protein